MTFARSLIRRVGDIRDLSSVWQQERPYIVSFVNPASYVLLREHRSLYEVVDLFMADGMSMALLMTLLRRSRVRRSSFDMTSIAPIVFRQCEDKRWPIAVIGATTPELRNFIDEIQGGFERLRVVYARHGYFANEEELGQAAIDAAAAGARVYVLGLGTPLQEKFACLVKRAAGSSPTLIFTCGGFIRQAHGGLRYYPVWVNRLQLRWVYRLIKEPHTRRRFVSTYSIFPLLFASDILLSRKESITLE